MNVYERLNVVVMPIPKGELYSYWSVFSYLGNAITVTDRINISSSAWKGLMARKGRVKALRDFFGIRKFLLKRGIHFRRSRTKGLGFLPTFDLLSPYDRRRHFGAQSWGNYIYDQDLVAENLHKIEFVRRNLSNQKSQDAYKRLFLFDE